MGHSRWTRERPPPGSLDLGFDPGAALVLVRVIRAGTFRAAAQAMGMPKTTVSRKVTELEAQLGVQLLHRTTRRLTLTDAGLAFVEEAEAALARLEAAQAAVGALQHEPRGQLRVTTTVPIGELLLAPLLPAFLEAYPAVELQIQLSDRQMDLVAERIDVALRTGALPESNLVALPLGGSTYRVVASPGYLEARGIPVRPSELSEHACLLFRKAPTHAVRTNWPFGQGPRRCEVPVSGRLVSDDFVVLRTAAEQGLGIARLPGLLVQEAIEAGRLVPVLDDQRPPPTPLHLLHAGGTRLPARTRAFIDFVQPRLTQALAMASSA
jgi:LysR family transcriptional regulator, regulator for bpeEF and oprC